MLNYQNFSESISRIDTKSISRISSRDSQFSLFNDERKIMYKYLHEIFSQRDFSKLLPRFFDDVSGEIIINKINSSEILAIYSGYGVYSDYSHSYEVYDLKLDHDRGEVENFYNSFREGEKPMCHFRCLICAYNKDEQKEMLKNSDTNRFVKYFESVLDSIINNKNFITKVNFDRINDRNDSVEIEMNICIIFDKFKFEDPFEGINAEKYMEKYPLLIGGLVNHVKKETLFKFIDKKKHCLSYLPPQIQLDYIKYDKKRNNPNRYEMEQENQMYIFIARPKFIKNDDGSYKRDIDIENLVPIDPYDISDSSTTQMMRLRTRIHTDANLFCIWLPKDFDKEDLQNINTPEMGYLRSSIVNKMEKI